MTADLGWAEFLGERGIDRDGVRVTRLTDGEVNQNWRIDSLTGDTSWVLRHYMRTTDLAEIECELSAVDHLGKSGFPTPAPIHVVGTGGRLWNWLDGRPAALFPFVPGQHPDERPGGYGSLDLNLAEQCSKLAGQLHVVMDGTRLQGMRRPWRDPWKQIGAFLSSKLAANPLFTDLIGPLECVHSQLAQLYSVPNDAPWGFIHNDIRPLNVLIDSDQRIRSLLDFDDSAQTFLTYELGAIVSNFGKDQHRRVDLRRIAIIIGAYNSVRPLTDIERTYLPEVLTAHAGAEGIRVLSHWVQNGRQVDISDSYSATQFLDLVELGDSLRSLLTELAPRP